MIIKFKINKRDLDKSRTTIDHLLQFEDISEHEEKLLIAILDGIDESR